MRVVDMKEAETDGRRLWVRSVEVGWRSRLTGEQQLSS
jgi:hypothetical protein